MTDSDTLRTAVGTLRAQEAKGRGKYGTDLDGAGLDALQLLTHATEEAADLLMYLTALGDRAAVLEASEREWYARWKAAAEAIDERDALAARLAELEAELSATGRTADEERQRAKRAERLLASESARVAELEAQNERWRGAFRRALGISDRPLTEAELSSVDWRAVAGSATRPLTTADRLPMVGDGLRLSVTGWVVLSTDCRAWVAPSGAWVYPEEAVEYAYRADGGPVTVEVTP